MKINEFMGNIINKYIKQSRTADEIKTKKQPSVADGAIKRVDSDKVEISDNAKLLSQLECKDSDKAERIESVKVALNSGTYKPDIDEIAKSVLKEWKGE